MYHLDIADAAVRERARAAEHINREGWKYEAWRRCRSAGRSIFHPRRRASNAMSPDC
jgi:hypothetical protein